MYLLSKPKYFSLVSPSLFSLNLPQMCIYSHVADKELYSGHRAHRAMPYKSYRRNVSPQSNCFTTLKWQAWTLSTAIGRGEGCRRAAGTVTCMGQLLSATDISTAGPQRGVTPCLWLNAGARSDNSLTKPTQPLGAGEEFGKPLGVWKLQFCLNKHKKHHSIVPKAVCYAAAQRREGAQEQQQGIGRHRPLKHSKHWRSLKMTSQTTKKYEWYLFLSLNEGESHGLKCRLRLLSHTPKEARDGWCGTVWF